MSRVNVDAEVWGDPRFEVLARLAGYRNRHEAIGRMAAVWLQNTMRGSHVLSVELLSSLLDVPVDDVVHVLESAELGERVHTGVRVRGCDGRTDWYQARVSSGREGGVISGRSRRSKREANANGLASKTNPPAPAPAPAQDPEGEARSRQIAQADRGNLANRLWLHQEELRKKLRDQGITCRSLGASLGAVAAVERILIEGYSESDCRAVLDEFYREAVEKKSALWFDGVTNWKPEPFRRALAGGRSSGGANDDYRPTRILAGGGS